MRKLLKISSNGKNILNMNCLYNKDCYVYDKISKSELHNLLFKNGRHWKMLYFILSL